METIQMLGSLGEFLGSIAVLATLIYLTIQVRHSRDAMEENSRLARGAVLATTFEHLSQFRGHIIDNAEVARIWREGCGGEEPNEDDRTRFESLREELAFGLNSVWGQAVAAGNEDLVKATPRILATRVHANPGLRGYWDKVREELTAGGRSGFVEAVDAAIAVLSTQQEAQQ